MIPGIRERVLRFLKSKKLDIQFSILLISTIIVNKYVLSELWFRAPTVFQGWQTFTCVIILSAMLKFEKLTDEVKIPDTRTFLILLPGFICFAISIVAGSKGLAELPVPIFCAVVSLIPALLILFDKKTDFLDSSKRVCGSVAICGTVVVMLVMVLERWNVREYLWLLSHVALSVIHTLYMDRVNVDVSETSKIYYRNCFGVVALLPISVYLGVLNQLRYSDWQFYVGCILSGVLGAFLQMTAGEMEKKPNYINVQGRSRLICSLIAHKLLFRNVEPIIWGLIVVNLLISSFVMSTDEDILRDEKKSNLTVILGSPQRRDLNIDQIVSV